MARHLLIQLLVDHVEDFRVNDEHEKKRGKHPTKEVEVDHVLHADDVLKLAGDDEVRAE